ncbi:MAG: LysM peptidoglycan-binding domain-containing protein [Nitrospirae bacterium]|nr:LysM peptidoglycan-binding domain-containing protein [Nitrospirota bacterium]
MRIYIFKYITLLLLLLSFSCSLNKTQIQTKRGIHLPEITPPITVENKETLSDITVGNIEDVNCSGPNDCNDKETGDIADITEDNLQITQDADNTEPLIIDTEATDENSENEVSDQDLLETALDFINASQDFWADGNLEKAIETLDQAYELILKIDADSRPELVQQQDDLRFMTAKRILEIYASRYKAVNGNHREIPLTMNEHVEMEIKSFQGRERGFFIESYKRSGRYMNKIKASLKEAGLPEELAWLPHIESWFKVKALSTARALGIWQFIPSTGYKFGLKRDAWIDERMDPEKSTAAAIAYLKELHQMFGDWTTVLAAYNCGEGAVLRRISNQKINYLDNFWDLYGQLPRETARYVPRFLATLHIMKDPANYGFTLDEIDAPVPYETVSIQKQVHLKTVADMLVVAEEELTALNPELRIQVTPPTAYSLKVPAGKKEVFLAGIDGIPQLAAQQNNFALSGSDYTYHRVAKRETLAVIAKKYNTSTTIIARANNLNRRHSIRVGQKLRIPLGGGPGVAADAAKAGVSPNGKYKVKRGDTLWLIAKKFNTDTKRLQQINNMRSTSLKPGQIILVTE